MLDAAPEAIVVVGQQGSVVALNREAERLFGWSDAELAGEPSSRLITPGFQRAYDALGASDGDSPAQPPMKRARQSAFARRRDGSDFPAEIHRIPYGPGKDAPFLVTIRDVTASPAAEENPSQAKEQAAVILASMGDALITTDVAGTITYMNPTAERLTGWRATEAQGQPVTAVLTLVSDATREPIESISARCLREGRSVDLDDGALLVRRDGVEIAIGDSAAPLRDRSGTKTGVVLVLHDVTERRRVARKLHHQATHDPLTGLVGRREFDERPARLAAEAAGGVAQHPPCYVDLDSFKVWNDTVGPEAGGNCVHRARPEAAPQAQQQVESRRIMRLSRAVDEGHFQLYAQATVPLAPERPARPRCEILLRLADERGGVETAGAFLPRAERHRLMPAIDRWVVHQTIAVLGRLHRDQPGFELPVCSINLSASSLDDVDLVPVVRETLAEHGLPPEALCFEISEAAALGNFAEMVRLISEAQAMGSGIGLDNFGNSLASLAHLKALPVDYVKIGGHYVRGVADDPVYGALVGAVREIGRIMGIVTIAKEVESETVLEKLRGLGVGYAQGHAVAAPAPLVDASGEVALPRVQRPAAAGAPGSNL